MTGKTMPKARARAINQRAMLRAGALLANPATEDEAGVLRDEVGQCQAALWRDDLGTMTEIAERLDRRLKRAEDAGGVT